MAEALELHVKKDYKEALRVRLEAHELVTGRQFTTDEEQFIADVRQGVGVDNYLFQSDLAGNARNIAATYERLGNDDEAERSIQVALALHKSLEGKIKDEAYLYREEAADEVYFCALALKRAIKGEQSNQEEIVQEFSKKAVRYGRQAKESFDNAEWVDPEAKNREKHELHQYELNATRRLSMTESLYGNGRRGFELGVQALRGAKYSEKDNPEIRETAVRKARKGALAALAINLCTSVGARKLALKMAEKAL